MYTLQPSRTRWTTALGWLRTHPYTVLGVILFVGLAVPFLRRQNSEWDDVYVRAARHLLAGETIYGPGDGYSYPPFMAWLSVPFALVPQPVSRIAWYLVNAVCLVLLCRCAWRVSGGRSLEGQAARDRREHVICLLGLACAFRYSLDALAHQQTDLVVGAFVLVGCFTLSRERAWSAATCLGLAAAMKCTALLWCPYFLLRGQWRQALWLVAVAAGVNLLPDLVSASPHGGPWLSHWLAHFLLPMSGSGHYPGAWYSDIIYNQSLSGLAHRFLVADWQWTPQGFTGVPRANPLSPHVLKAVVYGTELFLLLALGWLLYRRREPGQRAEPLREPLEHSVVLLLMVLLSPMSSKPHFCTLLLPAFTVARLAVRQRSGVLWALMLGALLAGAVTMRDLMGAPVASVTLWCGGVTWSALLLLAACGLALWRGDHVRDEVWESPTSRIEQTPASKAA